MATIQEHLRLAKRLTPINLEKNLFDSIRALETVILKLNEKQLDNSITATDAPIFSSKRGRGTYSRATEILSGGRKKEGDPYNLFNTGAFRNSLFINVSNKEAIFGSLDPKTPTLIDDYGINILGLNDENLTKVVKGQLLPMHQQYIRKPLVYKSLDILPVVIFHEIVNTNNYNLLCTDKFITEDLESIWDKLFEEYQKLTQGFSYEYMFGIRKKASSLMAKYQSVQVACNALLVTDDKELKDQLKEWGFDVSTFEKIEKVRRNSESILINAQIQESKLPKRDENAESKSVDIYESLATFMTILGIDLDFKSISVRKYIALEKAIDKNLKPMPNGKITREELITQEALKWGVEYAKNLETAEKANRELIETSKQLATISGQFGNTKSQREYTAILNNQAKALKTVETSEINRNKAIQQAEKARTQQLRNEKLLLDIQAKKERAQRSNTKLTIEERVANQALNKVKRQQARLQLGLVDTYEKLSQQRNKAQRDLQNLLAGNKANTAEITRAERRYASLNARLLKVDKATDNFTRNIGNYRSALGGLRGTLTSLTSSLGLVGGAFAFVQVLRNGVDVIRTFDKSSATLSGVLQLQRSETVALTQDAVRLGETTVKTSGQVTELQIAYARLGFSQKEILDLTEPTINGSIALNAELDRTAKLTGAVVNTFDDLATSDAPKILDILSLATAKSALEFSDLETGIPIVAGAANAAGVPFTKLIALQGKLADSGIDVSTSSTALRNIFIESAAQGLNFGQILDKIANSQDKLTASNDEFGKRASVSATVLAANIKATDTLDEALQNAAGTAQSMADKELDTLDGAIKLLSSAWEGYILNTNEANSVGNTLKNGLQFLAENLKEILNGVVFLTKAYVTYVAVSKLATLQTSLFSRATAVSTRNQAIARLASINQAKGLGLVSASSIRATLSVRALGTALKANAIGIGIAVIFGLVKAFESLNKSALETSKEVSDLNKEFIENQTQVNKTQNNLESLQTRYKELTKEGIELTKDEQKELNSVVSEIQKILPDTIVKVDEYGNSLITNSEKTEAFIKTQRRLSDSLRADRIKETQDAIDELSAKQERSNTTFREGAKGLEILNRTTGEYQEISEAQERTIRKQIIARGELLSTLKAERVALLIAKEDAGGVLTLKEKELVINERLRTQSEEDVKESIRLAKIAADNKKKALDEDKILNKQAFELRKFRQQETIRLSKQVADNDQESVDARVLALTEISIAEIELARLEKNNAIANTEIQSEKQLAVEKFASVKVESERNASEQTLKILEAEGKRVEDSQNQSIEQRIANELKAIQRIKDLSDTDKNNKIAEANEIADVKKREEEIKRIKIDNAKQALTAQLGLLTKLLDAEGLSADQRIAFEKKVSEIKVMLSEVGIAQTEKATEKEKLTLQEALQAIGDFANSINGLLSANAQGRIANIDREIEKNDEFFAKQLELVGDDDRRKEAIEQRQEQRRLELEAKKRREQVRQAKIDKAFALTQIAINTAIGVTNALSKVVTAPLVPLIIATGALQAATVLAQPIPQFEKGTQGTPHKGGFAEVAEKRPEVIIEPNKKPYIVAKNQILDLPKGTQVIPSVEEFKNSQRRQVRNRLTEKNDHNMRVYNENTYNSNFSDKAIVDELRANRKALKSKQPIIINNVVNKPFKRSKMNE